MLRRTSTFLAIAAGFLVMTAGVCPEAFCDDFPELCQQVGDASDESQPEFAAGDDTSAGARPDLAEPRPEREKS